MCYFDSDWVAQEKEKSESLQSKDIALREAAKDCMNQHASLTKLAELFSACARCANGDSSVQNEQNKQLVDSYRSKADVYRKESERALEAWAQNALEVVRLSRSRWPDIFTNCESMCKQADKDLQAFSQFHHRLNRQCELERCRKFIQLMVTNTWRSGRLWLLMHRSWLRLGGLRSAAARDVVSFSHRLSTGRCSPNACAQ